MSEQQQEVRLFVVDDEIGVRRSLVGKLRRTGLPLEVAGEAESAEQALELMKSEVPDIIILDMRMPGMGGYSFLTVMKQRYPEVKVIILSGYSDFEYAQQSLRCGAIDYLLKPVIKEDLERSLHHAIRLIRSERDRLANERSQGILLNQAVPLLKHQMLNRVLRPASARSAADKLAHIQVHLNYGHYALAIVRLIDAAQIRAAYMQDSSVVFFVFENIVRDSLQETERFICFPNARRDDEFICLIGLASHEDPEDQVAALKEPLRTLQDNLCMYSKIRMHMVVSRPFTALQSAYQAYEQAEYVLRSAGSDLTEDVTVLTGAQPAPVMASHPLPEQSLQALVAAFEDKSGKTASDLIRGAFQHPASMLGAASEHVTVRHTAAALYYACEQAVDRLFADTEPLAPWMSATYDQLTQTDDPSKLSDLMTALSLHICEAVDKRGQTDSRHMIAQAYKYIEHNYFEEITLESMAHKFYLNRTYFSELFKKETGWTFKKYLNHIRVEKAKELLTDYDLRPSAVCVLVGIQDPVYFSVLFKKLTGMPPGEYRKENRKTEESLL